MPEKLTCISDRISFSLRMSRDRTLIMMIVSIHHDVQTSTSTEKWPEDNHVPRNLWKTFVPSHGWVIEEFTRFKHFTLVNIAHLLQRILNICMIEKLFHMTIKPSILRVSAQALFSHRETLSRYEKTKSLRGKGCSKIFYHIERASMTFVGMLGSNILEYAEETHQYPDWVTPPFSR